MKSTGIIRRIDDLGRVVLPIELRKTLALSSKDTVEIYVDNNTIVLKKYEPTCIFCGSMSDAKLFKGRMVCEKCLADIQNNKVE